MTKLRMGIIGTGGIAQARHIPSYLKLEDKVEVVAVYDVNQELAESVAENFQIPHVFSNYYDLFEVVDAVTICTPNKFHAEISIAALEAGVHVLCEKPMAMNAEEAKSMIEAAKKANKLLSIAYHYRFFDNTTFAKQAAREIGEPLVTRVEALRQRKVPGWGVFTNKELQGGGSLIDFGCHFLDLSLWLLDNPEPVEVTGATYNRLSKSPNQINDWGSFDHKTFYVDDHVSAYITFKDRSTMLFECSWAANIKEDRANVSISGVEGGINVFPFESYQPKHGKMTTTAAKVEEDHEKAGYLQAKNFVESCLGEAELINTPEQALKVTKIIDAIYQSSERGTSVKL